ASGTGVESRSSPTTSIPRLLEGGAPLHVTPKVVLPTLGWSSTPRTSGPSAPGVLVPCRLAPWGPPAVSEARAGAAAGVAGGPHAGGRGQAGGERGGRAADKGPVQELVPLW